MNGDCGEALRIQEAVFGMWQAGASPGKDEPIAPCEGNCSYSQSPPASAGRFTSC